VGPNGESCYQPLPQRVAGIKHATKVSAGEDHTLVLTVIYLPELPLQDIFVSTGSDAADLSASHSASNAFGGDEGTENNYKVENRGATASLTQLGSSLATTKQNPTSQ